MFEIAGDIAFKVFEQFKPFVLPAGLVGTAYITYRTMPNTRVRAKMLKCFKMGEMHIKKTVLGKKVEVFPIIRSIQFKDNRTVITFSIPIGLNPEIIEKNQWIFKQQFGSKIELEQAGKRFILTIREKDLQQFNYNYEEVSPYLKDKKLPIYSGQSYQGHEIYDMTVYPHLLIAGETGSGKSTQLRSILTTLIKFMKPEQLELYLADLKRSEFHLFRRVQHVKEVAIRVNELHRLLIKIKQEMEDRGDLLDEWELAHIDEYNKVSDDNKKPYIIVCIDEVALLKKEKDIMEIIEDISAIGRALGVYLILSMQRPDSEVLDGKLKNNLTVRMAFRHSDEINSRITIGSGEAAAKINLNDKGRMYFKHEKLKLVQAPFLSLNNAKQLLDPYRQRKEDYKDMGQAEEVNKVFGVLDNAS